MSNKLRKPPKSFTAFTAQMKHNKVLARQRAIKDAMLRAPITQQAPPLEADNAPEYDWGRSNFSPGKGKKDGNCNRTACQSPLKGREQWYMRDYGTTDGRLYYCGRCARDFNNSDKQFNEPQRCTFDDETVIEYLSA